MAVVTVTQSLRDEVCTPLGAFRSTDPRGLLEANGKIDLALLSACYGLHVKCPSQALVVEHLVSSCWCCFRRLGKLWVQDAWLAEVVTGGGP